jgi:hypothetical protein
VGHASQQGGKDFPQESFTSTGAGDDSVVIDRICHHLRLDLGQDALPNIVLCRLSPHETAAPH